MGLANNSVEYSMTSHISQVKKAGICRKRSISGSSNLLGRVIHGSAGKGKHLLGGLLVQTGATCLPSEDILRIQKLIDTKNVSGGISHASNQRQDEEDVERARKRAILEFLTSGVERVRIKSESDQRVMLQALQTGCPPYQAIPVAPPTPMDLDTQNQAMFNANNQFGNEHDNRDIIGEIAEIAEVATSPEPATPLSELERMKALLPEVQGPSATLIVASPAAGPVSPASSVSSSSSKESDDEMVIKKPLTLYNGMGQIRLWQFIIQCLASGEHGITWTNRKAYEFKFTQPDAIAQSWGRRKNKTTMTYEKMSRSLRTYYKKKILRKVHDHRHVFQFHPRVQDVCRKAMRDPK